MAKTVEQRVEELERIVKQLQKEKGISIKNKLTVGDTFELMGLKWKTLDITEQGYKCIAEKLKDNKTFGNNNDWKESSIRKYLNGEFYKELAGVICEDNIIPFERNLISLDGQKEYGTCNDHVSILSLDEYRKYRELLPNEDYYWWTLTPDSTKCNDDISWIRVVCPSGLIFDYDYDCNFGVRPVCIFSSAIFESEEE